METNLSKDDCLGTIPNSQESAPTSSQESASTSSGSAPDSQGSAPISSQESTSTSSGSVPNSSTTAKQKIDFEISVNCQMLGGSKEMFFDVNAGKKWGEPLISNNGAIRSKRGGSCNNSQREVDEGAPPMLNFFRATCCECGNNSHSHNHCPLRKCTICGKFGHSERVCYSRR